VPSVWHGPGAHDGSYPAHADDLRLPHAPSCAVGPVSSDLWNGARAAHGEWENRSTPELVDMTHRFWISLIFTAPLVVLAMSEMLRAVRYSRRSLRVSSPGSTGRCDASGLWGGWYSLCVAGHPSSIAA
jgi:hypothetical protein